MVAIPALRLHACLGCASHQGLNSLLFVDSIQKRKYLIGFFVICQVFAYAGEKMPVVIRGLDELGYPTAGIFGITERNMVKHTCTGACTHAQEHARMHRSMHACTGACMHACWSEGLQVCRNGLQVGTGGWGCKWVRVGGAVSGCGWVGL